MLIGWFTGAIIHTRFPDAIRFLGVVGRGPRRPSGPASIAGMRPAAKAAQGIAPPVQSGPQIVRETGAE